LLDNAGQLKVAGFGLVRLSKISADKFKLADPGAFVDQLSMYYQYKETVSICRCTLALIIDHG